jgi:hypothetical protein
MDYLEEYYIGLLKPGSKTTRKVPFFPPKTWNVYTRCLEKKPRTQNNQEAWHGVFATNIVAHPDCDKV